MAIGRKGGLFWGSRSNYFKERCPTRMASHLKEVSMGWDHQMHAIEVGDERERMLDPY